MPDFDWPFDTTAARAVQETLRDRVVRRPPPDFSPRLMAGCDLSIIRGRDTGYAAIVVIDIDSKETVEARTAVREVDFPYVPGLLSFRELPPLAAAWETLDAVPDLVLFDAHGLAHPRRFGLACHGGLLFDTPSVGVAKNILIGDHGPLGSERGATAEIRHEEEVVGMALRTRTNVRPVYVSIGHRIDLPTAVDLVLEVSRFRHPEPIRRSHRLANELRNQDG